MLTDLRLGVATEQLLRCFNCAITRAMGGINRIRSHGVLKSCRMGRQRAQSCLFSLRASDLQGGSDHDSPDNAQMTWRWLLILPLAWGAWSYWTERPIVHPPGVLVSAEPVQS